jgi:HNH endonuclease
VPMTDLLLPTIPLYQMERNNDSLILSPRYDPLDLPLPPLPPIDIDPRSVVLHYPPPSPPSPLPSAEEQWKLLDSIGANRFEVSDMGRVRKHRFAVCPGMPLYPPRKEVDGRWTVRLRYDGYSKDEFIDELVARAFLGKPDGRKVVEHVNGDLSDDRAVNLRWVDPPALPSTLSNKETPKRTSQPRKRFGRPPRPVDQIDDRGNVIKRYKSIAEASVDTGLSPSMIVSAARGRIKAAKGIRWRYA